MTELANAITDLRLRNSLDRRGAFFGFKNAIRDEGENKVVRVDGLQRGRHAGASPAAALSVGLPASGVRWGASNCPWLGGVLGSLAV